MAAGNVKNVEIEKVFHVKLTDNQVPAIRSLVEGKDVFVGTRTGSGKSLIYECSPILFGKSSVCDHIPTT